MNKQAFDRVLAGCRRVFRKQAVATSAAAMFPPSVMASSRKPTPSQLNPPAYSNLDEIVKAQIEPASMKDTDAFEGDDLDLIEIVMEYEDMLKRQNPKQDISWLSSVGTDDSVPTTFGELRQLLRAGSNTRTA